jgi:hypothetical protein
MMNMLGVHPNLNLRIPSSRAAVCAVMSVHQQLSGSHYYCYKKASPHSPVHANPIVVEIVVPAQQQQQLQKQKQHARVHRLQATHEPMYLSICMFCQLQQQLQLV